MRRFALVALVLILTSHEASAAVGLQQVVAMGTVVLRAQLLTSQAATSDGEWIDVAGITQQSIHIAGITTATVEINGSNALTRPANSAHGVRLNTADITADQVVVIEMPLRWVKVRVSAWTSGTINAYLEGHAR